MKRLILTITAATAIFGLSPIAAQSAEWMSVNRRQASLDRRIDRGVRNGELTRTEASRLRSQYRELSRLESQYRRSGGRLTDRERRDLDQRFDRLSSRVRNQKDDEQERRYRRR